MALKLSCAASSALLSLLCTTRRCTPSERALVVAGGALLGFAVGSMLEVPDV